MNSTIARRLAEIERRLDKLEGTRQPILNGQTLPTIKKLVEREFAIAPKVLWSKCRHYDVVWPRQIAMHLARTFTDKTESALCRFFNRDPHTVYNACQTVKDRCETCPKDAELVRRLEDEMRKLQSEATTST